MMLLPLTILLIACTQQDVTDTVGRSVVLSGCGAARNCTVHNGNADPAVIQ